MKISKLYDKILIIGMIYYFIEVFFLHWLCLDDSIKFCSIIIILGIIVIKLKKNIKIHGKYIIMFGIFILYVAINILVSQENNIIIPRIIYYMITPISIYSFFIFFSKEKNIMEKYGQNIIPKFLNIYFLINIPILILQCKGDGFLMLQLNSSYFNQFYPDHISGLLGLDGTHKLAILTIAVLYANIYMALKTKKKIYYFYLIIDCVFSLVISTYNDNKAFFIILPLMLLPVIFKGMEKKIFKIAFAILICLLVFIVLCSTSDTIQTLLSEKIFYLFDGNSTRNLSEQERTYVVKYALEEGNGYLLGNGIGCKYPKLEPKAHFGINDMSVLIYEGGLIYYLIWCIVLTNIIYDTIFEGKKLLKMKLLIFFYVVFFIYYNQIVTNWNAAFLFGLIFLMYRNINEVENEENKEIVYN